jgi:hypothetical protein
MHVQIFCSYLLADFVTDPSSVGELMDCPETVFLEELWNLFNMCCRCLCLVALNLRLIQLTLDQSRNVNDNPNSLSNLKNVLKKLIYRASRAVV